jgi:glyoxylase-like metal-dependent hydrolase (beta-lactamase superfamily II)
MKIICLKTNPTIYSGNSFLLLGSWSTLDDVNAVVDTGSDDYIIKEIETIYTGVGKVPVNKVILTHNHFDHMGGATHLKKKYNCTVYAKIFTDHIVDEILQDEAEIRLADKIFTVIYTPGHSTDSLCLYCKEEQILFSGDTTLQIRDETATYTKGFVGTLKRLSALSIKTIYPGHGKPIHEFAEEMIHDSLAIVLNCKVI